jgi:hypothetical protein
MKIIATFIGTDSLGYEHGKIYVLKIWDNSTSKFSRILSHGLLHEPPIAICREDGAGFCPYQTIETFLQNWNNIKHIK